ncbi:MAG: hypothetical protein V4527_00620 [Pseudomonadota bacterium]
MKKFATELADFLRRHYPESHVDGSFRFSADIRIREGEVEVDIPILTRLPDELSQSLSWKKSKIDFGMRRLDDETG